jgi:hypothetical protein
VAGSKGNVDAVRIKERRVMEFALLDKITVPFGLQNRGTRVIYWQPKTCTEPMDSLLPPFKTVFTAEGTRSEY